MAKKALARHYQPWATGVHKVLKDAGVRQMAYVPDGGHARLIELCQKDKEIRSVVLTTEEEGVAQMAGCWLGGQRGVMLTQSGGVGNCINMLSIIRECRIPLLMLVPMGQATQGALETMGVIVHHADEADRVAETVHAASLLAFNGTRAVAVIVSQRLTGTGGRG